MRDKQEEVHAPNAERHERAVPDGWQLMPKEPNPNMLGAWYRYKSGFRFPDEEPAVDTSDYGAYRAMLAAAPPPPAAVQEPEAAKALEWVPWCDGYQAHTPFGSYTVEPEDGHWVWRYCFDEYYDEDRFICHDEQEGKRLSWENWLGRISPCISPSQSDHVAEISALREALAPLVAVADAYDDNALDDEARKFWGLNSEHENDRRPEDIELYTGRGGKRLLTLADCLAARSVIKKESRT